MKIDNDILIRYSRGESTKEEQFLVESWFDKTDEDNSFTDQDLDVIVTSLDKKIISKLETKPFFKWDAAAAAVAIVAIFSIYFYNQSAKIQTVNFAHLEDIKAPVSSNTVVILEDNREHNLDDIQAGDTLRGSGYVLTRSASGVLCYEQTDPREHQVYHTIRTSKGGFVNVRLVDGSNIWLNTESEIRYPVQFRKKREVALKGEAYFEISTAIVDNIPQPFLVKGEKQTIEVLGTKFNANFTNRNEVALLEGSIVFTHQDLSPVVMKPKQVFAKNQLLDVEDIEQYIDWKEGYFHLRKLNIYEIATELENWYGVKIQVEGGLPNNKFFGRVSRRQDLKKVLEILAQVTPIQYELKDNIVYIKKAL